jgi:hypothetical protein
MSTIVTTLLFFLGSLGGGAADWPSWAAVGAWVLVAALLGSWLHRLRELSGGTRSSSRPRRPATIRGRSVEHHAGAVGWDEDGEHHEAA